MNKLKEIIKLDQERRVNINEVWKYAGYSKELHPLKWVNTDDFKLKTQTDQAIESFGKIPACIEISKGGPVVYVHRLLVLIYLAWCDSEFDKLLDMAIYEASEEGDIDNFIKIAKDNEFIMHFSFLGCEG